MPISAHKIRRDKAEVLSFHFSQLPVLALISDPQIAVLVLENNPYDTSKQSTGGLLVTLQKRFLGCPILGLGHGLSLGLRLSRLGRRRQRGLGGRLGGSCLNLCRGGLDLLAVLLLSSLGLPFLLLHGQGNVTRVSLHCKPSGSDIQ